MEQARTFNMGKLSFYALPIKCSECGFDFSTDEQMMYELYLGMVEQSKIQNEPQLDKYVDYYKQMEVCPECNRQLILRLKFTKMHHFVKVEGVSYPIEKDCVWIATHSKT